LIKKGALIQTAAFLAVCRLPAAAETEEKGGRTVESVTIEGNETFTDRELRKLMVTRPGGLFGSYRFRSSVFMDDLSTLQTFYRQNGYLQAAVIDTVVVEGEKKNVNLIIRVSEGPVTSVEKITISGNRAFSDSTLLSLFELEPGGPFRSRVLQKGMMEIAAHYADRGYLDASVTPETEIDGKMNRVFIKLLIDEGSQVTISGIQMEGLEKTKPFVIRRELTFERGEVVSHGKLMESQKRLYLSGLFSTVRIKPVKSAGDNAGERSVLVRVEEEMNSRFRVSGGYGSVEKVMGQMEFSFNNLFGTARKAGINLAADFIERRAEVSFSDPRTFNTRFTTDLNLFYSFQDQPGFDISRYGGMLTAGREFRKSGYVSLRYRYENQQLRNVETLEKPDETEPNIRSMTLKYANDTRDNMFNPGRGWYLDLSYELAGAFLQGTDAFNRAVLNVRWFRALTPGTVFATSMETGWIDIFGSSGGVPINELFYTGGPNSIRGFEYRMAGPRDIGGNPVGGRFKLIWNLEIRQSVWRWIGVAAFLDVGNVWSRIGDYRFDSIRFGAGPGIRVNTPIGIIRFDAGFNPDPAEWEDNVHYYIAMGNAF